MKNLVKIYLKSGQVVEIKTNANLPEEYDERDLIKSLPEVKFLDMSAFYLITVEKES